MIWECLSHRCRDFARRKNPRIKFRKIAQTTDIFIWLIYFMSSLKHLIRPN